MRDGETVMLTGDTRTKSYRTHYSPEYRSSFFDSWLGRTLRLLMLDRLFGLHVDTVKQVTTRSFIFVTSRILPEDNTDEIGTEGDIGLHDDDIGSSTSSPAERSRNNSSKKRKEKDSPLNRDEWEEIRKHSVDMSVEEVEHLLSASMRHRPSSR